MDYGVSLSACLQRILRRIAKARARWCIEPSQSQSMARILRIGGVLALGLAVWTGCGTALPTASTPVPALVVPRIRGDAVEGTEYTGAAGVVEDVRGIEGLPTAVFLAVRGNIPCGPLGAAGWWIVRADGVSAERLQSLSPRLREVIRP